jgi:putative ABC transport system ATP-binding protein
VHIEALRRTYRVGPSQVIALHAIDLEVARGEFLVITGVSGSGKSTLLHLIGGLDTATSGRILVDGRELQTLSARQRSLYRRTTVGFVFQAFYLVPTLTAAANVALALTFQGTYGAQRKKRALEALERVGLGQRANHRPGQLSGGEQQRVAIARAIVHRPQVLLADEPTGNLDRHNAQRLMDLVQQVHSELGTTVILVTHDASLADRYADRRLHLSDGQWSNG